VAADIRFQILDERGREMLDMVQERTGELPYLLSRTERWYHLNAEQVDASGFDGMLDGSRPIGAST
jgi:hypothetical protein